MDFFLELFEDLQLSITDVISNIESEIVAKATGIDSKVLINTGTKGNDIFGYSYQFVL